MIKLGQAAHAQGRVKRATLEATITRADGTVEHLGVIAQTEFTLSGPPRGVLPKGIPMDLKYRVLHAQSVATQREVTIDGEQGTLTINRIVVELEPVDHDGGTLLLRFSPADAPNFVDGEIRIFTLGDPVADAPQGSAA